MAVLEKKRLINCSQINFKIKIIMVAIKQTNFQYYCKYIKGKKAFQTVFVSYDSPGTKSRSEPKILFSNVYN